MERGMFLAFEEEGYLRKLTLKKLSKDEVDETMKISLSQCSQNENHNLWWSTSNSFKIQFVFLYKKL